MGLPAKSPQAILWGPRKVGEQHSPRDVHSIPRLRPPYSLGEYCVQCAFSDYVLYFSCPERGVLQRVAFCFIITLL